MLKNVADFVTPVLTESHFADKGVLTPEEFVIAGDQLVFSCRTWQWSSGNKGTGKKYLPEDKQFLITRNVPSLRRAHTYALSDAKEEVLRGTGPGALDDGEGWLSTHSDADMKATREVQDIDDEPHQTKGNRAATTDNITTQLKQTHITQTTTPAAPTSAVDDDEVGDIDDMDDATASNLVVAPPPAASKAAAAADDFPDMEAFDDDDNVLAPPSSAAAASSSASASASSPPLAASPGVGPSTGTYLKAEEPEDNIVKTRTYDISIVYDKYYRTPRVYLFGYDEHRQPLTADQIMEDISADHANKTVTVETHPFLGVAHASIHPCKHAHVMKRIVDQMAAYDGRTSGTAGTSKQVDVKQYMYIFLKFISSVIPTIEYDYSLSG